MLNKRFSAAKGHLEAYVLYIHITYTYLQIYCTENILMAFMGIEAKSGKVFFQH